VALRVPGVRDSVLDGETGWLVERDADFGAAAVEAIGHLRDQARAAAMARACREWAACFSWDRSADLLAGVVLEEMRASAARQAGRTGNRRVGRSDMAVVATFPSSAATDVRAALRATDEVVPRGDRTAVLLSGCDEFDAAALLERVGVDGASIHPVDRRLLLAGPAALAAPEAGTAGLTAPEAGPADHVPLDRTA
jgi:hypothetical protein